MRVLRALVLALVAFLVVGASSAVAYGARNPAKPCRHNCPTPTPTPTTTTPTPTPTPTPTVTSTPTPTPTPTVTPTPTPTPTPSPTPTGTGGWASAGVPAGTSLTVVNGVASGPGWSSNSSGDVSVLTSGAVLNALDIKGRVIDNGRSYTLQNSRVHCEGENDWCVALPANSKILNSEIPGWGDGTVYSHAIAVWTGGPNNVIDGLLIHHHVSGIRLDGGTTVTNSYIRDLPMGDPVKNLATGQTNYDDHSGGIMGTRGSNVVLRGNRFEGGNTANVFLQPDVTDSSATISNWLVENNEFVNGDKNGQVSSWGFCAESKPGMNAPLTIRNNTFTRGWEVAPFTGPSFTVHSGNVYTDGTAID